MNDRINSNNNNEEIRKKKEEPFLRRVLDGLGNIFGLNICFVIGCIPIFTIGASLSALYATCIRLQENEEETIAAGFIREYKRSFKQATIAFLMILVALFVMFFQFLLVKKSLGTISSLYTGVLIVEVALMALILPFLFPLIARYNNKLMISVRNALVLSITYLGSWIKVVTAWVAPIAICIIYPVIFVNIWYMWLLFIFGAIAYGTSFTFRKLISLNEKRVEKDIEKRKKAEAAAAAAELEAVKIEEIEETPETEEIEETEETEETEEEIEEKK